MLPDHQRQRVVTEPCSSDTSGQPASRVPRDPATSISCPINDQFSWKPEQNPAARILPCPPRELRPHPSYARHGLAVSADKLSSVRARGNLALLEPLAITRDRFIIDGYARWELAKELGHAILHCIEYGLSETEALEWLLQKQRRSSGLNDYCRIMLAWDLEPALVEKARANRQLGGREKGWSNLTKSEQVHVRSEIAKAAAVSTGNVTKVKQLNKTCIDEITTALYDNEVSIHWAWKLRNESPEDQLDALSRFRFEKGLLKDVRKLAARRQRTCSATPKDAKDLMNRLAQLAGEKLQTLHVEVVKGTRPEIFITQELAQILGMEQRRLWNQSVPYNNLQKTPESCGPGQESARQSATI